MVASDSHSGAYHIFTPLHSCLITLPQVFGYNGVSHLGHGLRQLHRDSDTLAALLVHFLCAFASYLLVNLAAAMAVHHIAMIPSLLLTTPLSVVISVALCNGKPFDLRHWTSDGWLGGFDLCNPFNDGISFNNLLPVMACLLYFAEIVYALLFVWPVNVRPDTVRK